MKLKAFIHTLILMTSAQAVLAANTTSKKVISTLNSKQLQAKHIGLEKSPWDLNLLTSKYASWGIDPKNKASINLEPAWKKAKINKDVVVAVVDTGIEYKHPFLKDNIFIYRGKVNEINFGVDFSTKKRTFIPYDSHGHGTHVAGIVKSVYPNAKILPLKYYNPQASGQANLNSTIQALEYAVLQNVDIINYSGGGPEPSAEELRVLKLAEKKGILIIAAAGNERSNIDDKRNAYYPASYGLSNIISVAAHDQKHNLISSSNWGPQSVDIAAPGLRIKSAIPRGVGYMTGTSQATAFVTGTAAIIKAKFPELNYEQIRNIVLASSVKVKKLVGKVVGGGKLDSYNAIRMAERVNKKILHKKKGRELAKK